MSLWRYWQETDWPDFLPIFIGFPAFEKEKFPDYSPIFPEAFRFPDTGFCSFSTFLLFMLFGHETKCSSQPFLIKVSQIPWISRFKAFIWNFLMLAWLEDKEWPTVFSKFSLISKLVGNPDIDSINQLAHQDLLKNSHCVKLSGLQLNATLGILLYEHGFSSFYTTVGFTFAICNLSHSNNECDELSLPGKAF